MMNTSNGEARRCSSPFMALSDQIVRLRWLSRMQLPRRDAVGGERKTHCNQSDMWIQFVKTVFSAYVYSSIVLYIRDIQYYVPYIITGSYFDHMVNTVRVQYVHSTT